MGLGILAKTEKDAAWLSGTSKHLLTVLQCASDFAICVSVVLTQRLSPVTEMYNYLHSNNIHRVFLVQTCGTTHCAAAFMH